MVFIIRGFEDGLDLFIYWFLGGLIFSVQNYANNTIE